MAHSDGHQICESQSEAEKNHENDPERSVLQGSSFLTKFHLTDSIMNIRQQIEFILWDVFVSAYPWTGHWEEVWMMET